MKIASSSLLMGSVHAESQQASVKESLQAWRGDRRIAIEREAHALDANASATLVSISDDARRAAEQAQSPLMAPVLQRVLPDAIPQSSAAPTDAAAAPAPADAAKEGDADLPPMVRMIKMVIENLMREPMKLYRVPSQPVPASGVVVPAGNVAAIGLSYDKTVTYSESEQMHFEAQGLVKTADGQEINFQVALHMERSFSSSQSEHVQIGRAPKDPLVINFPGHSTALTDTKFSFDLDGDGDKEKISFVKPGSGFLVFDRNNDGKANDGKELFGTQSGNGFADLAELDVDQNGWIDENDPAFSQLKIWTKDESGQDHYQDLLSANVGALALQNAAAPFKLKDANNVEQGVMRAAGVYLQEDGKGAGTLAQVDLMV